MKRNKKQLYKEHLDEMLGRQLWMIYQRVILIG